MTRPPRDSSARDDGTTRRADGTDSTDSANGTDSAKAASSASDSQPVPPMDPGYSSFLDLEEEKSTRGPIVSSSPSDAGSQAGAEDPESDTGGQRLAHLAAKSLAWTGLVLGALMIVSAPDIAINTHDGLGRALVGAGFLVPAAWWFYCERAGRTDRYWPIVTVAALIILGTGASGIEST